MSKVIDVRSDGGDLIVLGKAFVLPASDNYGTDLPMDGSLRFNPTNGDIEMAFDGVWTAIQGGAGGGPIIIADVIGLQNALNQKSPVVHVHPMSEVSGLLSALDGKASVNHGHAIDSIPNLASTLASLQTQITNKSDIAHTHSISTVLGLETALSSKSPVGHTHVLADIPVLASIIATYQVEKVGFALSSCPPSNYTFSWTAGIPTNFPDNFAGSFASVDNPPTEDYIIVIKQGISTVGTITIRPDFSVVFDTPFANVYVQAGQKLTFICPAKDPGISNISITLVGQKA